MTTNLEKRILMFVGQAHGVPEREITEVYVEINSIDKVLEILEITKKENISFTRAFEFWKVGR